jgi:hypothetical protein
MLKILLKYIFYFQKFNKLLFISQTSIIAVLSKKCI